MIPHGSPTVLRTTLRLLRNHGAIQIRRVLADDAHPCGQSDFVRKDCTSRAQDMSTKIALSLNTAGPASTDSVMACSHHAVHND